MLAMTPKLVGLARGRILGTGGGVSENLRDVLPPAEVYERTCLRIWGGH
jgi:hypothetical protein